MPRFIEVYLAEAPQGAVRLMRINPEQVSSIWARDEASCWLTVGPHTHVIAENSYKLMDRCETGTRYPENL